MIPPTNIHIGIHEGILVCDLHFVPGWPPGSAFSGLQVVKYYFLCENWSSDPNKPTFRHAWKHIRVRPPYLYLAAGLQDQPAAASKRLEIIFGVRIEILTLTNLQLDIHEGKLEYDICICTWLASRGIQVDSCLPFVGFNNFFW